MANLKFDIHIGYRGSKGRREEERYKGRGEIFIFEVVGGDVDEKTNHKLTLRDVLITMLTRMKIL